MQLFILIAALRLVTRAALIEFEDDDCSLMSLKKQEDPVNCSNELPKIDAMHEFIEKELKEPDFKGEFIEPEAGIEREGDLEGELKLSDIAETLEKAKSTLDLEQPLKMITRRLKIGSLVVTKNALDGNDFTFGVELKPSFSAISDDHDFSTLSIFLRLRLVEQYIMSTFKLPF